MRLFIRIVMYIFFVLLLIFCLFPFYSVLIMATKENGSLFTTIPLLPGDQVIENLKILFDSINILRNFGNSLLVSTLSTFMNLFFSALAAYAFSKHRFKGKEPLFLFILLTMFVPGQLSWIGFVLEMKSFNLIDTLWPLILPSLGTAFGIFIMRGYMSEFIPNSLIEAARIDGCRDFSIFLRIVVPLSTPVLASLCILFFMGSWNNYSGALVILYDVKKYTLPLAIATLNGIFNNNLPAICVGILISTIPIIIVYLLALKQFIAALTAGAIKE